MPRKSLDTRTTEHPVPAGKVPVHLSLLPARTGLGSAQIRGQGTGPLWGLGQGPKVLGLQDPAGAVLGPGPPQAGTTHMPVFIVSLSLAMFRKSYLQGDFDYGKTSIA